jgi:hypothetical protein
MIYNCMLISVRSKSVPPPGYYELEDNDFDNSNLQGVVSMPLEEWYNL